MRLRYLPLALLLLIPGSVPFWPASATATLAGQVLDDHGPAAGARVRIKGQALSTRTDAAGRFKLPLPRDGATHVTAHKDGYFIAGARADSVPLTLTLHRLPSADCEDYAWVDPAPGKGSHNCGNCHGDIYREWQASGHARAAAGRHFRDLYKDLLKQNPDGAGVCTSCHAPTVPFGDAAYYDLRKVAGVAAQGVHCDYCHKVADVETGPIGLQHGRFGLKLLRPSAGQLFFGPLDDVDRGDDAFAPLQRSSRYCASCHEGTVFGVHAYSTYSEWLASPARREGKQCQTCHMAPTGTMTNIAPGKGGIARDPRTLANHRFFTRSQEEMLRDCLRVAATLRHTAAGLQADVEVRVDGVGHRVPTGFVDRHVVLLVEGRAASENTRLVAGPKLPEVVGAELSGQPGRLYAKQLQDFDGNRPAHFWQADPQATDTRLQPEQTDRSQFVFAPGTEQVRMRLLYRRFWPQVVKAKGWPDDTQTIVDRTFAAPPR